MAPLSTEDYQAWLKMRKYTLIIFLIESLLIGMDVSVTFLTLYMYLKEMVKTDNPLVYYGFITVMFYIPSLTLGGIIGHYIDRHRNVRLTLFTLNTLVILGSLLYAIPYSPWFLIAGRILAGSGSLLRSVMIGEIARSYPPSKLSSRITYMGLSYTFGYNRRSCFKFYVQKC